MTSFNFDRAAIEDACDRLAARIVATPTLLLNGARLTAALPEDASVFLKMELFQQAGSFKARGVLLAIDAMQAAERQVGVTAVSAGNHALAVSWGAHDAGLSAKVVMPKTADPVRVEGCRAMGAEVILKDNVSEAFAECDRLVAEEGRTMLHPFESPYMVLGAASVGLELALAAPDLDCAVLPIGGGGLIAGMALGIKAVQGDCTIIGVEPEGADAMSRSLAAGAPFHLEKVETIADSLGAPMALPKTFAIARQHVEEIIRLPDAAMQSTMRLLYDGLKIVAEPACAASTAAIRGPLRDRLAGKRVAAIACGSNIGLEKFARLMG